MFKSFGAVHVDESEVLLHVPARQTHLDRIHPQAMTSASRCGTDHFLCDWALLNDTPVIPASPASPEPPDAPAVLPAPCPTSAMRAA